MARHDHHHAARRSDLPHFRRAGIPSSMSPRTILALSVAVISLGAFPARATPAVPVQVILSDPAMLDVVTALPDRPPLSVRAVLDAAAADLGLELSISDPVPFRRALRETASAPAATCLPFVVRTPEREAFLRFSEPVLPEEVSVIVYRADNAAVARHARFDDVLRDAGLTLSKRDGLFYGREIEEKLKTFATPVRTFSAVDATACTLVARGRADYCISTVDALADLKKEEPELFAEMRAGLYPDSPKTEAIRIGCNHRTPEAFIARVNQALGYTD